MYNIIINEVGPYQLTLNIGDTQVMNFTDADNGPF